MHSNSRNCRNSIMPPVSPGFCCTLQGPLLSAPPLCTVSHLACPKYPNPCNPKSLTETRESSSLRNIKQQLKGSTMAVSDGSRSVSPQVSDRKRDRSVDSRSPAREQPKSRSRSAAREPKSRSRSPARRSRSPVRRDSADEGGNLYIRGLASRVTDEDLQEHFEKEGKVNEQPFL